jgi:hypothetical protein
MFSLRTSSAKQDSTMMTLPNDGDSMMVIVQQYDGRLVIS